MKNCIICGRLNDTDNNSCSKCWKLNGVSWAYTYKLSVRCPNCNKPELVGGGLDGEQLRCDNCGHKTSEGILFMKARKN